jgi:hypothetical protein
MGRRALARRVLRDPKETIANEGSKGRNGDMNVESGVKSRATIIKVPDSNPGLLVIDGVQKPFVLEGVWMSPVAPSPNQVVDVVVDGAGAVTSVTAVDPQQLAKERMNQLGGAAQEHGKQAADLARAGFGALAARMGKVALGASAVVWIAWFFLPAVVFSMFGVSRSLTLWDVLGADLGKQGYAGESHGLWALVGLVAIVSPFVAPFLRHPRARFLYAAPLAFVILTVIKIRWGISSTASDVNKAAGNMDPEMQRYVGEMARNAMKSMMAAFSLGYGAYVLIAASMVLAAHVFMAKPKVP